MANSAIVGMLRAILVADTAQFDTAMGKSSAKIGDLGKETTRAAQNLAKMLGGDALVKKANDITQAMGLLATRGIKLTADEAAKLEPVVSRAIAKLEAMGKAVDPSLRQTQQSLKGIADQAASSGGVFDSMGKKLLAAFSAGLLIDRGISAVIGFGREALSAGGRIQDMSTKLGVSMEAVQRWSFAAKQTGTDMDALGRSVTFLSDQLSGDGKAIIPALTLLNLQFEHLRNLKTEDAVNEIFTAIKKLPDAMQQIQVAKDLFGKTGVDLLPGIKEGMVDIGAQALVMSDDTVRALDKAGDAWQAFYDGLVTVTGTFLGNIQRAFDSKKTTLATLWALMSGADPGTALAFGGNVGMADEKTPAPPTPNDTKKPPPMDEALKRHGEAVKALADTLTGTALAKEMRLLSEAFESVADWSVISAARWADAAKKALAFKEAGGELTGTLQYVVDVQEALDQTMTGGGAAFRYASSGLLAYVSVLKQHLDVADDVLAVQRKITASADAQRVRMFMQNFDMGAAVGLGSGAKFEVTEKALTSWQKYGGLISQASVAMLGLARSGVGGWREMLQAMTPMIGILSEYSDAMVRAKDDTERMAAAQSASANIITGALTFGVQQFNEMQDSNADAIKNIRDAQKAFEELGYTVEEVNAISQGGRFLPYVLAALEDARTRVGQVSDKLSELAQLGPRASNAMQPMIKALLESTRLTKEQRDLLNGMSGDLGWQDMEEAANRYGIALDSLGAKFQQNKIGSQFDDIFTDFTNLTDAGADAGAVLTGMADEVQALLNNAMKFGSQLPEFMKPMLQSMVEMGLLTDDAGNALKDLSRFNFTASIESSFQRMADILAEIRDLLAFGLPQAAKAGAAQIGVDLGYYAPRSGGVGGGHGVDTRMPMLGSETAAMTGYGSAAGMSVPSAAGGTVNIYTIDAVGFEQFLRQRGGAEAIARTLDGPLERWGKT